MNTLYYKLCFDAQDFTLRQMVNHIFDQSSTSSEYEDIEPPALLPRAMHANGVAQLSTNRAYRIALAAARLLENTRAEHSSARLDALRVIYTETGALGNSSFRYNTSRVLVQLMKEIIRTRTKPEKQLEFVHAFHSAASGKPRTIRKFLQQLHLLEMPEDGSQHTFDYRVYDIHTGGKKVPAHLIMDAWIKGIKKIKVIYPGFVDPTVAKELLIAAEILDVQVRIGFEYSCQWRDKAINFFWSPRGFSGKSGFLSFLEGKDTQPLIQLGQKITYERSQRIIGLVEEFNTTYRKELENTFQCPIPSLPQSDLVQISSSKSLTIYHLAECIHYHVVSTLKECFIQKKEVPVEPSLLRLGNTFSPKKILRDWAKTAYQKTEKEAYHTFPTPQELIQLVAKTVTDFRLSAEAIELKRHEMLQLIYECNSRITHLELYPSANLNIGVEKVQTVRNLLNNNDPIGVKKLVLETKEHADTTEEDHKILDKILQNLTDFIKPYRARPLSVFIGSTASDNGNVEESRGMGFAIIDTLPHRTKKQLETVKRSMLSLHCPATFIEESCIGKYPWQKKTIKRSWNAPLRNVCLAKKGLGNITQLGGKRKFKNNGLITPKAVEHKKKIKSLSIGIRNFLLIAAGFTFAFTAFQISQPDSWLAWAGAPIWFLITGARNVVQAVIGGGGFLRRVSLLRWHDYVNWSRLADSLFFTGISVPLLELLVRKIILDSMFNITTENSKNLVFLIISLVNGLYISSHSLFRGLPVGQAYAGLFRSFLSVPVAIFYNVLILALLNFLNIPDAAVLLTSAAAIISKFGSDSVAAILGGWVDYHHNLNRRLRDYKQKFLSLRFCRIRLDKLFPKEDSLAVIKDSKNLLTNPQPAVQYLVNEIVLHGLDLLYFLRYQPCGWKGMQNNLAKLDHDSQEFVIECQKLLVHERFITERLIQGAAGNKFGPILSFYLNEHEKYLSDIETISKKLKKQQQH